MASLTGVFLRGYPEGSREAGRYNVRHETKDGLAKRRKIGNNDADADFVKTADAQIDSVPHEFRRPQELVGNGDLGDTKASSHKSHQEDDPDAPLCLLAELYVPQVNDGCCSVNLGCLSFRTTKGATPLSHQVSEDIGSNLNICGRFADCFWPAFPLHCEVPPRIIRATVREVQDQHHD